MKLSVLIPSVHTRRNTFLPTITDRIFSLYELLTEEEQSQIEIIILTDNKKQMLGEKRNVMIDIAQGDYVVFVDDDDRIEDDYLKELLKATESDCDVITYLVSVSINGSTPKICTYSKSFDKDHNTPKGYFRLPNHICCVKRQIANNVSFPNISYGEDAAYSKLLKPYLKTEHKINKVLYHYDYNEKTTETQMDINNKKIRKRKGNNPVVDVVILSNAKTEYLKELTQNTVNTCISGANSLIVNVIVIEQQPNVSYKDAELIYHNAPFNYNQFANLGAKRGSAEWIMIANNDLTFKNGWLHNLLIADHPVVSPKCPKDKRQKQILKNTKGYINAVNFSGWCFMIKRTTWEDIQGFDEDFSFWCADDSVIEQLKKINIPPMIVPSSVVEHLQSTTFNDLDSEKKNEYTWGQVDKFNKKYNQNKFHNNLNFQQWKQMKK